MRNYEQEIKDLRRGTILCVISACICMTAVILLLLAPRTACASFIHQELEQAIHAAAEYSRYELPARKTMPRVIVISTEEIDLVVPPLAGRSAYGYYNHDRKTIYLSALLDDMDPVDRQGWLIHEAVHWLQDMQGRRFETCIDHRLLEAEAYAVQNRWLEQRGGQAVAWSARLHPCH